MCEFVEQNFVEEIDCINGSEGPDIGGNGDRDLRQARFHPEVRPLLRDA